MRIKNLKQKNACICRTTSQYAKYWFREYGYRCGKGYIQTNEFYQTKESHIYAIGDVIGGLQLAHVASHEGIAAVEHIAGKEVTPIDYSMVSKCVYSSPEVASVGLTEQEAKEKAIS